MAKKKSGAKTNAARILDGLGISYELKEYPVDPNDLSAVHVAESVGMPFEQVFKTLVARGDKSGVLMACIPGDGELDLKELAAVSGNKRVEMVHLNEVLDLTGYVRGGCSPLGAKKAYPVYIDVSAETQPIISISAGKRGEQIVLVPAELIRAANATVAKLNRRI
ncbi:MAG: Cys-tRNA(Pro) deacylase [Schwartzia sp.]|nr:Cys-tRNA(Pro) deacylase [Schwartzia sp. (in: firmicutes)]